MQDHLFIPILFNCSYQNSWKELATSANSEKHVGKHKAYLFIIEPGMRKCVLCHMWTTKAQISLRIRAVWSAPLLFAA